MTAGSVLVTGGGTGLGAAMAVSLSAAGYTVHVAGRTAARLDEVVARVRAAGGEAHAIASDVRDPASVETAVDRAAAVSGRLDVLVNNAGVFRRGGAAEVTDEDWELTLDTNLTGAMFCARAAARRMRAQDPVDGARGQIVNVNSGAGLRGYAAGAAYSAAKFGLMGLSAALREELAPDLVKVTDLVVAAAVESELSGRTGVRRLPAHTVGALLVDALRPKGAAVITRVDLEQLPDPDAAGAGPPRAGRDGVRASAERATRPRKA